MGKDIVIDDESVDTEGESTAEPTLLSLLNQELNTANKDKDAEKEIFASFIDKHGIEAFLNSPETTLVISHYIPLMTDAHITEIVEQGNTDVVTSIYDAIDSTHPVYGIVDERAKKLIPLHRITSKNVQEDDFASTIEEILDVLDNENFDEHRRTLHNAFISPNMNANLVEKIFNKLGTFNSKQAEAFHKALTLIVLKMREKDYPGITSVIASITSGNMLQTQELIRMMTVRTVIIEPVDDNLFADMWDEPELSDGFYKSVIATVAGCVDKNKPVEGWEERVKPIFKPFIIRNYYILDERMMAYFRNTLIEIVFEKSNGAFDMETLNSMPTPQIIEFFKMMMVS